MKKSVVLAIFAVYILSIVIVGLLGMKIAVYDEIKYVDSIKLIDSPNGDYTVTHGSKNEPDTDFIRLEYKKDLSFRLYYEVSPIDATDTRVAFEFDTEQFSDAIEITSDGIVTVKVNQLIYVYGFIISQDGNKVKSRKICIYIKQSFS